MKPINLSTLAVMLKCEVCHGSGILLNTRHEIERCDLCEKFKSDHAAWKAAKPKASRQ